MAVNMNGIEKIGRVYHIQASNLDIEAGHNPRQNFDGQEDLENSIQANGVRNPISVRRRADNPARFYVIDGERRFRACSKLVADNRVPADFSIPCYLEDGRIPPDEQLVLAIIANQGKPFTAIEEADAFRRFVAYGWTEQKIAQRLGVSQSLVNTRLLLLKGAPELRQAVAAGDVAPSLAVDIIRTGDHSEQAAMAALASESNEGRDAVREEVTKRKASKKAPKVKAASADAEDASGDVFVNNALAALANEIGKPTLSRDGLLAAFSDLQTALAEMKGGK